MQVLNPNDRVRIKAAQLTFIIAPMTSQQKGEVMACIEAKAGSFIQDRWDMTSKAIRFSLKAIEGLTDVDDKPVVLELGADGCLTDAAMDIVMNIPDEANVAIAACLQFGTRAPSLDIIDPTTGKTMEGIEVCLDKKKLPS